MFRICEHCSKECLKTSSFGLCQRSEAANEDYTLYSSGCRLEDCNCDWKGGWGDVATMMGRTRLLYKLPPAYSSSILPAQLGAVVVVVVVGLTVIKTYSELGTRDNCRHNLRHCFPRPTKEFISLQNGQHPPPPSF